jgi:hypothetical protein
MAIGDKQVTFDKKQAKSLENVLAVYPKRDKDIQAALKALQAAAPKKAP